MISKDSDYLNNKLRQLKSQVLNKQNENGDQYSRIPVVSSERYVPNVNQNGSAYVDTKPQGRYGSDSQNGQNFQSYTFSSPNIKHQFEPTGYQSRMINPNEGVSSSR